MTVALQRVAKGRLMRRPPYLPALAIALALSGPGHAATQKDLCNVLVLMEAVLTLPSDTAPDRFQRDAPRRDARMEQSLIHSAFQALDKAQAQRALPDTTLAQYRAILSDRAKGHRPDPAQAETVARITRQVQQDWWQNCKTPEDHASAPQAPDPESIGPRLAFGPTPPSAARRLAERSGSQVDQSSAFSGVTAAHQWWMLATVIAAAGVFGLAGKGYFEMQGHKKRRAQRFGCNVAGCLSTATGTATVRVRDISRLGCLLRIDRGPAAKTRCRVWVHDRWLDGRVAWSNKCYVGLEFRQLQSSEFVIEVARSGRAGVSANPSAPPRMPEQGA